ncbi:phosphoacetylglucosamine mutase-like protein [Leptotrombidium deliense]|uniref:phosphoacetylglucosamine mutase n=1 Tax=Leptotrombidium deliense TaxID=299467 RepID=A0A443SLL3_9ACAR|nr:phosphoacetylglucosamine mutase-like protein [Leptotrombidium deliense]
MQLSQFLNFAAKHPKSNKTNIPYGTAGFRYLAVELDSVLFRMGALASLRSSFKKGSAIGLVVTASHNPEEDNGVKIIDPFGEMLESSWESIATNLANAEDSDVQPFISSISDEFSAIEKGLVFVARDTRKSSEQLAGAAIDGVRAVGGEAVDFGLLTTPQLHFIVSIVF